MAESYYTPGVCNINPKEIAYRKKFAYGLAGAGIVGLLIMLALQVHPLVGLILFIFFWFSAINFLQVRHHFCVSYAASGLYNTSAKYGDTAKATAEQHAKDKSRARTINLQGALFGLTATFVACALLYFV